MFNKKFNKKERLYLYQFLIDMISSDLPIFESLQKLASEGGGLLGKGFLTKVSIVLDNMKTHSSVSSSFADLLPDSDVGVFVAADRAGDLKGGLSALIDLNLFRSECYSSLRSAVMMPLILFMLTFVVIAGYSVNVFPAFIPVVPVDRWPTSTGLLYALGLWIYNGGWILLIAFSGAFFFLMTMLLKNLTGPIRESLARLVPFSTYRQFIMTDVLVSLYLLLKSGIPYIDALTLISKNSNRYTHWHMDKIISNMSEGLSYGDAMKTGLLDKKTVFDFSIYSELPSFVSTLKQISTNAQKSLLNTFMLTAGLLKNFATAFLGGVIVWVFVALFALIDVVSQGLT